MDSNFNHIYLAENFQAISYTAKPQQGQTLNIPDRDRKLHASKLNTQLAAIWSKIKKDNEERSAVALPIKSGAYIEFRSQIGRDLITKSLEDTRKGIRLLNVKYSADSSDSILATVYVPKGKEATLIKKIKDYEEKETANGNFKNKNLVESIEDIRLALVESLWTDSLSYLPSSTKKWCEVWLRTEVSSSSDQHEPDVLLRFRVILESLNIEYKQNIISFPERVIMLIYVNKHNLEEIIEQSDNIAEFRAGQETAGFWVNEKNIDQVGWVNDLLGRLNIVDSNVKVCILDTGVSNGHPLISPLLKDEDCLTVDALWGVRDHDTGSGHGTPMAGIIAYGNMEAVLASWECSLNCVSRFYSKRCDLIRSSKIILNWLIISFQL